jgi:hypothetical protein
MNRPYFDMGVPFLAGGVVFLLVAYLTGAMTATNTANANVAAARIDERAIMCQEAAVAYLTHKAEQTPAGVAADAADLPKALAEQFYVASGDISKDRAGREECTRKLSV